MSIFVDKNTTRPKITFTNCGAVMNSSSMNIFTSGISQLHSKPILLSHRIRIDDNLIGSQITHFSVSYVELTNSGGEADDRLLLRQNEFKCTQHCRKQRTVFMLRLLFKLYGKQKRLPHRKNASKI